MVWLYNARICAIIAVVMVHVANRVVESSDTGSEYWWVGNIYGAMIRWCVPVFIMISGALLLEPSKEQDLPTFYKRRVSRVLVPLLFWAAFFTVWKYVKGTMAGDEFSTRELVAMAFRVPYYHLWFLYTILGLYLFTPFLRKVVAHCTRGQILFLVCAGFLLSAVNRAYDSLYLGGKSSHFFWFLRFYWSLSYIPYFLMGHVIRHSKWSLSKPTASAAIGVSVAATALGYYYGRLGGNAAAGEYFYEFLSITVIPMSIGFMYLHKSARRPIFIGKAFTKRLSALTFGIYLMHPLLLVIIGYVGCGPTSFHPAVAIPVVVAIACCAGGVAVWAMSKVPYIRAVVGFMTVSSQSSGRRAGGVSTPKG